MLIVNVKLNVDDIIASLSDLDQDERDKLQLALFNLNPDNKFTEAVLEAREDIKAGRTFAHRDVMKGIKEKYYR